MVDRPATHEAEFLAEQPYDASDKKSVNNARKKSARLERDRLDFVVAIMSVPQGRKWMNDLLNSCKIFGNAFVPGDPYYTAHNLGEQNIGKKLLQDISAAAPDNYVLMIKEAREAK